MRKSYSSIKILFIVGIILCAVLPFSIGYQESRANMEVMPDVLTKPLKLTNDDSEFSELSEIDKSVNNFIKRYRIPGASVAITKNGKLVYAKGFGVVDKESQVAVQPYHRFRIASVSKLVTAIAVMKLVEEGKFSLESQVFGEEGILNSPFYNDLIKDDNYYKIKLKHLLDHTGGWSTRTYGDPMFKTKMVARSLGKQLPVSQQDVIEFVLSRRLPYKPGTYYNYSNFGYMLLGKVIEKASSKSYERYVREDVLMPLSIFDMQLAKNCFEDKADGEVTYYDYDGASERVSIYGTGELTPKPYGGTDLQLLEGAGGWIASPAQLIRLISAVDGFEDRKDILSKETISKMVDVPGPGFYPIGWRGATSKNWFRTGTLAGTSALVVRRNDSINYVVVMNSGTWRGPRFNYQIKSMMRRSLDKVSDWPKSDFFEHYELAFITPKPTKKVE